MNLLDEIIAYKKKELADLKSKRHLNDLEKSEYFTRKAFSLTESIMNPLKSGIIAEFKRKSPSRGIINSEAGIKEVTTGYSKEGASGLSILTDPEYFGGNNEDLSLTRTLNVTPILRKDFIIDEYQVIESKSIGADAILLIAAALKKNQITRLARFAGSLGLQVLLEVHNLNEIEMGNEYIHIIGVNNRDLSTFKVDTGVSFELSDRIPGNFVKISESGLSSPEIIIELKKAGYDGFLIGEKFMKDTDPAASFAEFTKQLKVAHGEN